MKNRYAVKTCLIFLCIVFALWHTSPARAGISTMESLIIKSDQLDGQIVNFQGEVVGDIMRRGDYCWINVHDGTEAIGVYCPAEMVQHIKFVGDYKHTGDMILVQGTFHKACRQHGGELDIHAERIRIIKTGALRSYPLSLSRIYLAVALLLCTVMILGLFVYRRKVSA